MNIGHPIAIAPCNEDQFLDLGLPEQAASDGALSAQDHRTFLWARQEKPAMRCGRRHQQDTTVGESYLRVAVDAACPISARDIRNVFGRIRLDSDIPGHALRKSVGAVERVAVERARKSDRRNAQSPAFGPVGPIRAKRLYPGKYLEIAKFRDRNRLRKANREFDFSTKIKCYDIFGFFASSFLKTAQGVRSNCLAHHELNIII